MRSTLRQVLTGLGEKRDKDILGTSAYCTLSLYGKWEVRGALSAQRLPPLTSPVPHHSPALDATKSLRTQHV